MFIDKDSILVNGISFGQYLSSVKYSYNKLWSSDSGRNLAGTQSGTLIGIFPKLTMSFRTLSQKELETIAPILDSASQSVTYYDPVKKINLTIDTYTGDYEIENKNIGQNGTFTISFIATKKRA